MSSPVSVKSLAALLLAAASLVHAREKEVTLAELIQSMKAQEQEDGFFRANISDRGELKAIFLNGEFTQPEKIRALAQVTTLESLSLGCAKKESVDEVAKLLPAMRGLKKLNITSPDPQAWRLEFFKTLGALREIRQLRFSYATIPVGAFHFLGDLPNLQVLELPAVRQLTSQDLRHLQRCPNLVELNLSSTRLDDTDFITLLGMRSLKLLDIGRSSPTWIGRAALSAKGVTLRRLADHQDIPQSPWKGWMECSE
jgi:hypothetical protein